MANIKSVPPLNYSNEISQVLGSEIAEILRKYNPSEHSFFHLLRKLPTASLSSPERLGRLYFHIQSAAHAMRLMSFQIPHLDGPDQRMAKLHLLMRNEADHEHLRRAFGSLGAISPYAESAFGELDRLAACLRPGTASVLGYVVRLFPKSLGAWVVSEMAAPLWKHALLASLTVHFPEIGREPFFAGSRFKKFRATTGALELVQSLADQRPFDLEEMLQDALDMALQLDRLWSDLQALVLEPLPVRKR